MIRVFALVACGAFLLVSATAALAAPEPRTDEASAEFIRRLGSEVLAALEDDRVSQRARTQRFYELFQNSFNGERISVFALGKHRRAISPDRFDEYRDLFGKYMTGLYAAKFANYSGETFVVTGSRKVSDRESDVTAEIRRRQGEPIRLIFRIDNEGRDQKIYDVVIEGVSLLFAKRQEITSVIARDGIDRLIERLREAVQLAELQ